MGWQKSLSVLIALAILMAACSGPDEGNDASQGDNTEDTTGDTSEEQTDTTAPNPDAPIEEDDDAPGDDVEEPQVDDPKPDPIHEYTQEDADVLPTRINPVACMGDDPEEQLLPLDPGADFQPDFDLGPTELATPPQVEPDEENGFFGPLYRPGILLGPPGFDRTDWLLADDVQLAPVELSGELAVEIDGESTNLTDVQIDALNEVISVWWIVSAREEELLDPVNVAVESEGALAPAYVMIPTAGHMYGPEGPAIEAPTPESVEATGSDDVEGSSTMTVAVIDTSFGMIPDVGAATDAERLVGHGAFIAGILVERLPNADVKTVDMGPEGQKLATALEGAIAELYERLETDSLFGIDTLQLAVGLAGINGLGFDGINMSFGTYECPGADRGDELTIAALRRVMTLVDGSTVFAAAGNDWSDDRWYPAAFGPNESWIFSVGATHEDGSMAMFSNYGTWVEVCAHGAEVVAKPDAPDAIANDLYFEWNGTSFATPVAMATHLGGGTLDACPPV